MIELTLQLLAEAETVKEKADPPSLEQVIILGTVLVSLLLVAFYVVSFFRGSALGTVEEPVSHLDDFRRLREEGMLDEEEFKQVKTSLIQEQREKVDFREETSDEADRDDQS